jgi:hypothetical protein
MAKPWRDVTCSRNSEGIQTDDSNVLAPLADEFVHLLDAVEA